MSTNKTIDALVLDIHNESTYKNYIHAKQYDSNTRTINIQLTNDRVSVVIESGTIARIRGVKSDGKSFIKDCTISGNIVKVDLDSNMLSTSGRVTCDIGLYQPSSTGKPIDEKLISSSVFYINVEKSAYDESSIISSNDYQSLVKLIAENRLLKDELVIIKKNCQDLIIQMQQLIDLG